MHWRSFVPASTDPQVFVPMFRNALQGTRSGLVGGILLAALLSWLFRGRLDEPAYSVWLAGFLVVGAVRGASLVWMARTADQGLGAQHAFVNTAFFAVAGVLWGLAGFAFPVDTAPWAPYVILTSQVLLVTMAVPALSWYWPCFVAFALPVHLLAPWPWLRVQPEVALVVAVGAFFILVTLAMFAARHAAMQLATLRLRQERAQMLAELQDKSDALSRNLAVKSRFLAAASHDLRQPLHAMGLLLKDGALDAAGQRELARMVSSTDEMLQSLVEAARGDDPEGRWPVGDCAVQALVDEVLEEQAPHAAAARLLLRVRHGWWTVRTNPVAFKRIVRNLLSNAIKYTRSGGVLVALRRRDGRVWLEVWDTGCGIAPEDAANVFAPYQRLAQREAGSPGTGLGLAVVRQLCDALGHEVSLASRPGRGCVFRVDLGEPVPAAPAPAAVAPGALLFIRDGELATQVGGLLQQWGLPWRHVAQPQAWLAGDALAATGLPVVESAALAPADAQALRQRFERAGRTSVWLGAAGNGEQGAPLQRADLPLPLEPVRLRAALNRLAAPAASAAARWPANAS